MMNVNLSPSHVDMIRKQAKGDCPFIGTSLKALYKLIQKKGDPIKSPDSKYHGVMAMQFSDEEYIAIKHTPVKHGKFFPCMIQTLHLENI